MFLLRRFQIILVLILGLQTICRAATVSLLDVADTEIIQGGTASASKMHVGANQAGVKHRSLLRFN
jgi:hypothetical protein